MWWRGGYFLPAQIYFNLSLRCTGRVADLSHLYPLYQEEWSAISLIFDSSQIGMERRRNCMNWASGRFTRSTKGSKWYSFRLEIRRAMSMAFWRAVACSTFQLLQSTKKETQQQPGLPGLVSILSISERWHFDPWVL